jgi:hypothetical protein
MSKLTTGLKAGTPELVCRLGFRGRSAVAEIPQERRD